MLTYPDERLLETYSWGLRHLLPLWGVRKQPCGTEMTFSSGETIVFPPWAAAKERESVICTPVLQHLCKAVPVKKSNLTSKIIPFIWNVTEHSGTCWVYLKARMLVTAGSNKSRQWAGNLPFLSLCFFGLELHSNVFTRVTVRASLLMQTQ